MEKPKSKVIKSKSSNSAIATNSDPKRKPESYRKKSKSSAEFQTLVKKRGVYVENKHTKLPLDERATDSKIDEVQPVKPPPRPRPGSKRFLASVLSILSKSTTGTQYPDTADHKKVRAKTKPLKDDVPAESEKKKKSKFKSKILNETNNQVDKFEVLQSKKEIIQTPSLYSERSYKEDIKWSDLPRLVKPEDEANESNANNISNLVREVTEGRKIKEKKVKVIDPDPPTLVSEHKDDKKMYNFFVDLLETTFSVYNLKADYEAARISSAASSKIALEMDESVARKLNVGTGTLDATHKHSQQFYCIKNDENHWNDDKLIDYFQPASSPRERELPLKPAKRRRLNTESFSFTRSKPTPAPQSKSAVITKRKSFYKNNKKQDLLNILKEELKMDHVSFEEPRNLYQALRVMAKNKRKQKTIRFDRSAKVKEGYRPPECMLKRRKVISPSIKSSSKYENEYLRSTGSISRKFSEVSGYTRDALTELSNHSLEVYGFDYEVPYKRAEKREEVFLTYHSSPSASGHEDHDMLKVEESSSTIRDFNEMELL